VMVRIGVIHTGKELELELADDTDRDALQRQIEESIGGGSGLLWLTDRRGRRVGIPAGKIGWIELGEDTGARRVGFSGTG
jgi:uncharacterized protein DUF3107